MAEKKCERRAVLMALGVSGSMKEGNLGCCLPEASFLASHTEEGDKVER